MTDFQNCQIHWVISSWFGFVNFIHKNHLGKRRLCNGGPNLRLKVVVDYILPQCLGLASRGGQFVPHEGLRLSEMVAPSWGACSNLWNKVLHWFWEQKLLEGSLKGPTGWAHRPTSLHPPARGARAWLRVSNLHAQKILKI